jgi:hypothetical protein
MTRLHEISIWVVAALLVLPPVVMGTETPPIGNQLTVPHAPQPQSDAGQGATSTSKEETAKKNQDNVQPRGLFKKKKKKQKGGATGHSQSAEQAHAPGR